jgi:hypothetical protein
MKQTVYYILFFIITILFFILAAKAQVPAEIEGASPLQYAPIYSALELLGVPMSVIGSLLFVYQQIKSQTMKLCEEAHEFKNSFDNLAESIKKTSEEGLKITLNETDKD